MKIKDMLGGIVYVPVGGEYKQKYEEALEEIDRLKAIIAELKK